MLKVENNQRLLTYYTESVLKELNRPDANYISCWFKALNTKRITPACGKQGLYNKTVSSCLCALPPHTHTQPWHMEPSSIKCHACSTQYTPSQLYLFLQGAIPPSFFSSSCYSKAESLHPWLTATIHLQGIFKNSSVSSQPLCLCLSKLPTRPPPTPKLTLTEEMLVNI